MVKQGEALRPEAKKNLDDLKNKIVHGKPLDVNHPGMANLTPSQQTNINSLLRKLNHGKTLPPRDLKT